jgi:hypothetical protein
VSVEVSDHAQRLRIVDIAAVGTIYDGDRKVLSKEVLARVKLEARKPVASPDFRITQHVDYFPTRGGVMPVLPMSGLIEWTGKGPAPRELSVAESVEDVTLATPWTAWSKRPGTGDSLPGSGMDICIQDAMCGGWRSTTARARCTRR